MADDREFEPQFRISPRKPAAVYDNYGRMPSGMKQIERKVAKLQAARPTGTRRPWPKAPGPQSIARIHPVPAENGFGAWRQAGKYLAHNKPGQQVPWKPFGPDGPVDDPRKVAGEWHQQGDEYVFLLVLSPEDSRGIDLEAMMRDVMGRLEGDRFLTGAKGPIEWMAVAHYDTLHPHIHAVIRGAAGGQQFYPSWDFSHGTIQRHAADVMAQQLRKKEQNDKAVSKLPGISTER
jgi:hypothetical protein